MAQENSFHFDVEKSVDEHQLPLTTIKCHGRLVSGGTSALKDAVKPLIDAGGQHIVIDCSELDFLDSSGLGILVSLKASSIHRGLGKLELVNVSPRIAALLKLTSLTELFST